MGSKDVILGNLDHDSKLEHVRDRSLTITCAFKESVDRESLTVEGIHLFVLSTNGGY